MNKYKSIVEEIEKNAVDYGKNNDEIVLLTQKCFQVSDLYKVLIEKKEAEKKYLTSQYVFLLRDYNSNKRKSQKRSLYIFTSPGRSIRITSIGPVRVRRGPKKSR